MRNHAVTAPFDLWCLICGFCVPWHNMRNQEFTSSVESVNGEL